MEESRGGPSYAWQIEKPLEQNIGNTAMQVVTEELGETRLFHVHILSAATTGS